MDWRRRISVRPAGVSRMWQLRPSSGEADRRTKLRCSNFCIWRVMLDWLTPRAEAMSDGRTFGWAATMLRRARVAASPLELARRMLEKTVNRAAAREWTSVRLGLILIS